MIAATTSDGDPVGAVEAGREDDHAGDRGDDEGDEVGEDVLEAALDVHRLAVRLRELPGRREVDDDPDEGDDQDRQPVGAAAA